VHSIAARIQVPAEAPYAGGHTRSGEVGSVYPNARAELAGQGAKPQAPRGLRRAPSDHPQDSRGRAPGNAAKPASVPRGPDVRIHAEFRKDTGDLVFEVRDHRTGETIRQFPPEALLDAGQQLEDLRGILVSELG
jgi:hypothetical protein